MMKALTGEDYHIQEERKAEMWANYSINTRWWYSFSFLS